MNFVFVEIKRGNFGGPPSSEQTVDTDYIKGYAKRIN